MSMGTNRSPSLSAALRNAVGTVRCDAPKKNGIRTRRDGGQVNLTHILVINQEYVFAHLGLPGVAGA